jgi:hypothetical protein
VGAFLFAKTSCYDHVRAKTPAAFSIVILKLAVFYF